MIGNVQHQWIAALGIVMLAAAEFTSGAEQPMTMSEVLQASLASDWRRPETDNLLIMETAGGQVVFELAPSFAPRHIENIRKLVEDRFFDGAAVTRSQENYVVQWGDPGAGTDDARDYGAAAATLAPEFFRNLAGLAFSPLGSADAYADEVGFVGGFPVGSDGQRAWLAHCYGMLGVGRANAPESGNGAELYVVIGHAPRHLDRNVTLIGRAIWGMEHLSTLPRGSGPLGSYEAASEQVAIRSLRFGDENDGRAIPDFSLLKTDTDTFGKFVSARRNRTEDWFIDPGGRVGLCNVPLPVRQID
jgi:peptidylprolyl isomerase